MTDLSRNIIQTIAYYDVLDYPMTSFEIWKYLIVRGGAENQKITYSLGEIIKCLGGDDLAGKIEEYQGFYFLPGRKKLVERRIERNKISEQKFRIIRRVVWFLRFVPYIRMAAVTGRMATKNASKESDLDLIIVLKGGKIFTGRTLVTFVVHFLGKRRYGKKIADRICLNYFITDKSLEIQLKDLFSSSEYSFILPIIGWSSFRKFQLENREWIQKIRPNYQLDELANLKMYSDSEGAKFVRRWTSLVFSSDFIEKELKEWETRRIMNDPRTRKPGSMILADDDSLVFLPDPQGPRVFEKFKNRLEEAALD